MPKHQAPRSWAKMGVTELPARARWALSGSYWNCERAGDRLLLLLLLMRWLSPSCLPPAGSCAVRQCGSPAS
jgi:hypothetical protein